MSAPAYGGYRPSRVLLAGHGADPRDALPRTTGLPRASTDPAPHHGRSRRPTGPGRVPIVTPPGVVLRPVVAHRVAIVDLNPMPQLAGKRRRRR